MVSGCSGSSDFKTSILYDNLLRIELVVITAIPYEDIFTKVEAILVR